MDDKSIDQIQSQLEQQQQPEDEKKDQQEAPPQALDDVSDKEAEEQKLHDEIDSLYYGDGYSEYTGASRRSQKTSATYISKLEKELNEEREARERLEKELEEIKKISSEISSHLGLNKPAE